jgi:exodeoxyribonuclease-3
MINLVSWNVNGIRAVAARGDLSGLIDSLSPDIFCVQETKMQPGQALIETAGYTQYWYGAVRKGYSGTAVFTKVPPINVRNGIGVENHDLEGRVMLLEFGEFNLVNIYTPNSQQDLLRLQYRMEWEDDIRAWLAKIEKESGKPIVLCGDLNVAHREIDLKHPRTNRLSAGFTDEEREKMTLLLESGYCDTFRHFYPDRREAYTWWSYIGKARERNTGWRIDYFIVSSSIVDKVAGAVIYDAIMGSDHCPVGISLDMRA